MALHITLTLGSELKKIVCSCLINAQLWSRSIWSITRDPTLAGEDSQPSSDGKMACIEVAFWGGWKEGHVYRCCLHVWVFWVTGPCLRISTHSTIGEPREQQRYHHLSCSLATFVHLRSSDFSHNQSWFRRSADPVLYKDPTSSLLCLASTENFSQGIRLRSLCMLGSATWVCKAISFFSSVQSNLKDCKAARGARPQSDVNRKS